MTNFQLDTLKLVTLTMGLQCHFAYCIPVDKYKLKNMFLYQFNYYNTYDTAKPIQKVGLQSSSAINNLLVPKTTQHTFVSRSFSVSGPSLGNKVPDEIKGIGNDKA